MNADCGPFIIFWVIRRPEQAIPKCHAGPEILVEVLTLDRMVDSVPAIVGKEQAPYLAEVQRCCRMDEIAMHGREDHRDDRDAADAKVKQQRSGDGDKGNSEQVFSPVEIAIDRAQLPDRMMNRMLRPKPAVLRAVHPIIEKVIDR